MDRIPDNMIPKYVKRNMSTCHFVTRNRTRTALAVNRDLHVEKPDSRSYRNGTITFSFLRTMLKLEYYTEHSSCFHCTQKVIYLSANVSLTWVCVCLGGNVRKTNHATPVAKNWFVQLSLLQKIQYLWNTPAHPDYITFQPSEPHSRS